MPKTPPKIDKFSLGPRKNGTFFVIFLQHCGDCQHFLCRMNFSNVFGSRSTRFWT